MEKWKSFQYQGDLSTYVVRYNQIENQVMSNDMSFNSRDVFEFSRNLNGQEVARRLDTLPYVGEKIKFSPNGLKFESEITDQKFINFVKDYDTQVSAKNAGIQIPGAK